MTRTEFIAEVAFILNEDPAQLTGNRLLASTQGFDSAGILGLIAFFDAQLGVKINVDALRNAKKVDDLAAFATGKITEG